MSHRDDEIREEIEFHLDAEKSEREAEGLTPQAAGLAAHRHLGNATLVAEDMRAVWRRPWWESVMQDGRYALRSLRREPGFALAAILCLTLGIGANTGVFSVVNACLLRSLPFTDSHRMVAVYENRPREGMDRNVVSHADFLDWRDQAKSFAVIAASEGTTFNFTGAGEPQHPLGAVVTADFFAVLGSRVALGRGVQKDDESPPGARIAVVTHGFWQRHLNGDSAVIGRAITLDNQPYTVIGVLAAEFVPPVRGWELFVPMRFNAESRNARGNHNLTVLARLAPAVSLEQARAEMDGISKRLEQEHAVNKGHFANVVPIHDALRGELRPGMTALTAAAGLVLLMACFNVANLLLARSLARGREISTRLVLGASRLRVIRQLLTESLVLSVVGAACGFAVAWGGVTMVRSALPVHPLITPGDIRLDLVALGYATLVAVASAILSGLAPAVGATSGTLMDAVKSGGRLLTPTVSRRRQHAVILVAETATALMLLIGAGLFLRSFWKVQSVEPGFRPEKLLTMQLTLSSDYREAARKVEFQERMIGRVRALPGVSGAGFTSFLPFTDANSRMGLVIDGIPPDPGEPRRGNWRLVTPGYIETMKIPLRRGRLFNTGDRKGSPLVMMVNETAARRYWKDRDPVGSRARLSGVKEWATVVGVVGDVQHWGLEHGVRPEVYYSSLQSPFFLMSLVVRTEGEPEALMSAVRGVLRDMDKDIPPLAIRTMEDLVSESNSPRRFLTMLVAAFAVIAVLLAAGGIFAQLAYAVSQRYQEIGIRLALGARHWQVVTRMISPGIVCAVAGVTIGLIASAALARLLQTMLFEVKAVDAWTYSAAAAAMLAVAAAASFIPAWRASQTDPAVALRLE
jgi:putative ABC transport system permease protein